MSRVEDFKVRRKGENLWGSGGRGSGRRSALAEEEKWPSATRGNRGPHSMRGEQSKSIKLRRKHEKKKKRVTDTAGHRRLLERDSGKKARTLNGRKGDRWKCSLATLFKKQEQGP